MRRLVYTVLANAFGAALVSCGPTYDYDDVGTYDDEDYSTSEEALSGRYQLQAVHSGKCVDVQGGTSATGDGVNIQQWTCHTLTNQQWDVRDLGNGAHELVAVHSGKCMDIAGASLVNGGNVQQYRCAGVNQQRFGLVSRGSGQYQLKAVHSGKCLDVSGGSTADGANIHQWTCHDGNNQRFTLKPVGSTTPPPSGTGPLGSGWVQYSPTKKIHLDDAAGLQTFSWTSFKSVCSPVCADYRYDSTTDTETFRILDSRSNRSEIRLQNEYSSGRRQFQGYVRFSSPLNDESLMQIFGSTSGATQLMIRGYSANNGELRGGGATLASNVYGVEQRVNVIHRQGQDIRIYINGSLRRTFADTEAVTNYHKYGVYGTLRTPAVTVRWRGARSYKDGYAP